MEINKIRSAYIRFFEKEKHKHLPAASIINHDDPALLFTNSGMNPFTSILLGHHPAQYPRVVDSQPCLRVTGKHNDLDEVGHDTYHHTLFEMLGNWSFGDYFKEEAIHFAWELLTDVFHLPKNQIYATVFKGDKEDDLKADLASKKIWANYLPTTQIVQANKKDNFWEMGAVGPCGPCSEIHIDLRSAKARQQIAGHHLVNKDHPQVIEIWNLVFMEYNRLQDRSLQLLPQRHVDTGMGLERLAMALQNKKATYDTDAFTPLLQWIEAKSKRSYGQDKKSDIAMRVIADHIRAITFAIADGVQPSPQKAGYVIRRILRRALRYGYSYLNLQEPFLHEMVPLLAKNFTTAYPHLTQQCNRIEQTIKQEEINFLTRLDGGLKRVQAIITQLPPTQKTLQGEQLFELYDTYGFPPDLTKVIAEEQGYKINEKGFAHAMSQQKKRSKKATERKVGDWQIVHPKLEKTTFVGWDTLLSPARIIKYRTITTQQGHHYQIVLDQTPFYAEKGGQVGDQGFLAHHDEKIKVIDTQIEHHLTVHHTQQLPKDLQATFQAVVDQGRRKKIERNHTATHLLNASLKSVLGDHIQQKGSLVDEKKLRFDFTHHQKITQAQLQKIEQLVNQKITENHPLKELRSIPLAEAKTMGATALFQEKYGKFVRVVIFDPTFSVELCGGTHLSSTGEIGYCQIRTESGIAAGIRRIEAITSPAANQAIQEQQAKLATIKVLLHQSQDPIKAIQKLLDKSKAQQKTIAKLLRAQLIETKAKLANQWQKINGTQLLIEQVEAIDLPFLKKLAHTLKSEHPQTFVALVAQIAQRPHLIISLSPSLTPPHHADQLIEQLAPIIGGKGGGQPTEAVASGTKPEEIPTLLQAVRAYWKKTHKHLSFGTSL